MIRVPVPDELGSNGLALVRADEREIVVLSVDGALRAVDRWCIHEDGDLAEGMMFRGNIKFPVHGYIFNLANGRCLNAFGMVARVYAVEMDGNELLLTELTQPAGRGL